MRISAVQNNSIQNNSTNSTNFKSKLPVHIANMALQKEIFGVNLLKNVCRKTNKIN